MQPTLVLSASHPGIVYINGHFAGEICTDVPLMRPVGSRGAVYLEYRSFSDAYHSMARKLVFSGGIPLTESVEEAENLNVILWPGAVTEIEISPKSTYSPQQRFQLNGHKFSLDSETLQLVCDGHLLCTLPEGAEIPELLTSGPGTVLTGRCKGGKYLLCTDTNFRGQTGFLRAEQLDMDAEGHIRALASPSDLVGHATLEHWQLTQEGLRLIASEPAWTGGIPQWPKTPEETARAAVEAALAGLDSEAERYLSPSLRSRAVLADIRKQCDLCVEIKYAPASSRPCIGLLHLENDRLARVSPLYFRASPSGDIQVPYRIDEFENI